MNTKIELSENDIRDALAQYIRQSTGLVFTKDLISFENVDEEFRAVLDIPYENEENLRAAREMRESGLTWREIGELMSE